ncbi:FUSC family protein [Enterococcus dongliensis]|uniref:FUSC family protein n=1 Tax=Enterococcus dongliensis TaxID=2559925 RepID=A0AAP5NM86_9ENTE|nr:FUSC family protein [Enterococcus dongliensis]MDT2596218.1 FUSC family protein [Enterococcus dongliensis]MDT2603939.1 FUSC family protein [Enterococcus dongliensis]MDT2634165.1 FUSC family protein [Enterococcus dongliensis]MDT2637095.1 FUSC family protein [Enterococcus dongliensis]MDT2642492.1 FUSC family protein [Enterococcus dongliensis]
MEQSFLKELIHYNKPKESPFRLIGAGLCMISVLLTGYLSHQLAIASFGSLGIFTFLYYQRLPLKQLLLRLLIIGSFLTLGNFLGMLSTHASWTAPIVVALIGFLGRFFFRLHEIAKPGPFFVVMVTAMGTSTKIPLTKIPFMSSYFFIGVIFALIFAFLLHFMEKTPLPVTKTSKSLKTRIIADPAVIIDSLLYSCILFFAVYLSMGLQLENPYWLVVSCAAILQGDTLRAMAHRNVQRIFGTIIGLLIAAFLLNLPLSIFETLVVITLLFVTVEYFIKRNYALAQFFTTPMSLMLAMLAKQQYLYTLIQFRFLGIVIGSLLGLLAAYLINTSLSFYNRTFHSKQ